jgi:acyl carrier protein
VTSLTFRPRAARRLAVSEKPFMTVQDDIRRYIIDELGWTGDPGELTDDLDLIEHQVLDSLSVVEFSVLLEQRYGVEVRASELVYEHFHSLGAIAAYVATKQRTTSQPAVP